MQVGRESSYLPGAGQLVLATVRARRNRFIIEELIVGDAEDFLVGRVKHASGFYRSR
jgi:hypothetical protein